nr:uncharacterized protein LOC117272982 [Nicotiana tomentosiformis]
MASVSLPSGLSLRCSSAAFHPQLRPYHLFSLPCTDAADFAKRSLSVRLYKSRSHKHLSVITAASNILTTANYAADMDDLQEPISKQTGVSFKLTKDVFSKKVKGDRNMAFSPLSIQISWPHCCRLQRTYSGSAAPFPQVQLH